MNLQTLASHTVDLDLLREAPAVLDVGCRGFDFVDQIYLHRSTAKVTAMDPARDVMAQPASWRTEFSFMPVALVGTAAGMQHLAHFSTGEGDFLSVPRQFAGWDKQPEFYEVPCITISQLM